MILTIQMCLVFLSFYIFFCECSPVFKDTFINTLIRSILFVGLIVLSWVVKGLSETPFEIQLFFFGFTIILTLYVCRFIFSQYSRNKKYINKCNQRDNYVK